MTAYCDRLSFHSCFALLLLKLTRMRSLFRVFILDPLDHSRDRKWIRVLGLFGIAIEEADFFAGALRTRDGKSASLAARVKAFELSFVLAAETVERSRLLRKLNVRWKRNTLLVHLSRIFWQPLEETLLRVFAADAMAQAAGGRAILVLHRRPMVGSPSVLSSLPQSTCLRFCGIASHHKAICDVLWSGIRSLASRPSGGSAVPIDCGNGVHSAASSLLILQEDDLGMDRSYRLQPHWLSEPADGLSFDIFVLPLNSALHASHDAQTLRRHGIRVLPQSSPVPARPVELVRMPARRLLVEASKCAGSALLSARSASGYAQWAACLLFLRAALLANDCQRLKIRVFMTAENHAPAADAMQIVAEVLPIETISYQYGNLGMSNPLMITTAKTMLIFSQAFRKVMRHADLQPGRFIEVGYPYDGAFGIVKERSFGWRKQLERAGVRFAICYFDENVQNTKYGILGVEEHRAELLALLRFVLEDDSLGLIVKTKLVHSVPSRLFSDDPEVRALRSSGRYLELEHGRHRNTVLASEAALASDLAIGHSIGATASLEASLAGTRSLLLNPYGYESAHDEIYRQANVVYTSMEEALLAIRQFRQGDPAQKSLGDWSSILPYFDSFRDGESASRIRRAVENGFAAGQVQGGDGRLLGALAKV